MALKGFTQAAIARKLGVSKALVSATINGRGKNQRVRKAIVKALRLPVRDIWPDGKRTL
ncbi:MAG: helix-turn-helix domain-containing protein [Firmicutes bacterium]|nr:helix-turn-helix domain-containing protein [Bacillota bacterium]